MRKKLASFLIVIMISLTLQPEKIEMSTANKGVMDEDLVIIPEEAIRFRIIANSDSSLDQQIKYIIRDHVNYFISEQVKHVDNIEAARPIIENNLQAISLLVKQILLDYSINQSFDVTYGENILFPYKKYGPYAYEAGLYEAVVITLGDGAGENWWCVLFPPLCLFSFSDENSVADATEEVINSNEAVDVEQVTEDHHEEVQLKFFIFEWLGLS